MIKKVMLIGLFLLVVATLPTVSAATYNVTNGSEFISALMSTTDSEIVVNLKENIVINSSDVNALSNGSIESVVPVTINGNNRSVSILSNGEAFLKKDANNNTNIFVFKAGPVNINKLVINDSNIIDNGARVSIFNNSQTTLVDFYIKDLIVYNVSAGNGSKNGNSVFGPYMYQNATVVIDGFSFSDNKNIGLLNCMTYSHRLYPIQRVENGKLENNSGEFVQLLYFGGGDVENVSFNNNNVAATLFEMGPLKTSTTIHGVTNCSFVGNRVNSFVIMLGSYEGPSMFVKNCYFEDNVIGGILTTNMGNAIINARNDSSVIHCTFLNNIVYKNENVSSSASYFGDISYPNSTQQFFFNTFVNNLIDDYSVINQENAVVFGNLFVNSTQIPEAFADNNLAVNSYSLVFGSNQPALNGGKTKNIQLLNNESNPALNKISAAEYQAAVGVNPVSDKDQIGKKRIYGQGVDYGSVELQREPIFSIIDNIINGNDDESGKTKPSWMRFFFGEDSIFSKISSLQYYIMKGWADSSIPIINQLSRIGIDLLRLGP
ncbi:MAG: hypothetical protein RBR02_09510 [Desulfuromonadaceae bacterium]|nr:hypothetical protein [Desulfuromonadaceae bacterium]